MNNTILHRAIELYGAINQMRKAVEELTELSLALQHRLDGKTDHADVIQEVADVKIMAQQMAIIFGSDKVDEAVEMKLDRLIKRIIKGGK